VPGYGYGVGMWRGWSFDGAKNGDGMSRVGRHLGWYYLDAAEVCGGSVGSQYV
jgi:hypothetical protein